MTTSKSYYESIFYFPLKFLFKLYKLKFNVNLASYNRFDMVCLQNILKTRLSAKDVIVILPQDRS